MGGKNSNGTSSTSVSIPSWIQSAVAPLLQGSAGKMGVLQDQGWSILQGQGTPPGMSLEEVRNGYKYTPDPKYVGGGGGGGRNLAGTSDLQQK